MREPCWPQRPPSRNEWFMAGLLYSSNLLSRSCRGSTDLIHWIWEKRLWHVQCVFYFISNLFYGLSHIDSMQGQCVAALFKQLRWWTSQWRWININTSVRNQIFISCHCFYLFDLISYPSLAAYVYQCWRSVRVYRKSFLSPALWTGAVASLP